MASHKTKKTNPISSYPAGAQSFEVTNNIGAGFNRVEPFITPTMLKQQFLFGIPLISPITQEQLQDETIKDYINRAAASLELELNIDIHPVIRIARIPFDYVKFSQGFNQLDVGVRNVRTILEVSVRTAHSRMTRDNVELQNTTESQEGDVLYNYPLEWVDMSHARKGILHLTPLLSHPVTTSTGVPSPGFAIPYTIASRLGYGQIPGFWFVKFESGFPENSVPAPINEAIGTLAAINLLSLLAPTNRVQGMSIGIDGASQSISTPGVAVYTQRIADLTNRLEQLKDIIKAYFSNKIFMRHL